MKSTQGKTHLPKKRVISSNCVNVIVFWKPRPVKVGVFFAFFLRSVRGENRFYTFYNFYNALNQRINIENDRLQLSTFVYKMRFFLHSSTNRLQCRSLFVFYFYQTKTHDIDIQWFEVL